MMNKRQKIVQKEFLNAEEKVIGRLDNIYTESLADINKKIAKLDSEIGYLQGILDSVGDDELGELAEEFFKSKRIKVLTPAEAKSTLKSMLQSKIHQKNYQEGLKKQVGGVLDKMHEKVFTTVSDYLNECYENGFVGTLYDLQGQGIPLSMPLDQRAMVRAVQLDSKISQGLYKRLGVDVADLKKRITSTISRGISTGMTFKQIAQQLDGQVNIGYNRAVRIARTEGHRIQVQSGMDACEKAKEKGADVVKQWDSTLDSNTRESHVAVDGEIREINEKFSNGLMFPGDPSGRAEEVINCRCALLQRAKWAVGGNFTKMNNFTKQLETFEGPDDYADFKKAFFSKENKEYMDFVERMEEKYGTKNFEAVLGSMTDKEYNHFSSLTKNNPIFNKQAKPKAEPKPKPKTDIYSFTDEQSEAIEWYVSGEGQFVNQYYRGRVGADFGELTDNEKALSNLLDEATDRDLPDDIDTLYRSVDARAIFGDMSDTEWSNFEEYIKYGGDSFGKGAYADGVRQKANNTINNTKGKKITEKGFMSTTKSYDVAAEWGDFTGSDRPIVIEFVDVPKGVKGADLKLFDIEGEEQQEVLLARNTKYEVLDVYVKDGIIHAKARIIID